MPRPEKVAAVEELRERLARASAVVVLDYRGLPGGEMTDLRRFARRQGVELKVVKNTLTRLAAQEAGIGSVLTELTETNALLLGEGDPALPFRVARECVRRYPTLKVKAGLFDRAPVSAAEADFYANLPTREELLAKLAGALAAPIRGLAVALSGVTRKLAVALSEVQRKKGAEG